MGMIKQDVKWNGAYYKENYENSANKVSGGEAKLQRRHVFVQDTWQVNDNTILTPIIRLDNSGLFGREVTANLEAVFIIKFDKNRL